MIRPMLLVTLLITATGANAATRQALNRCNDAARTMRMAGRKHYLGRDLSPLELKNASGHFRQVIDAWKRAQAQLAQVPQGELDWKDPQLAECAKEIKEWQDYLVEIKGKVQGASAEAEKLEPFLDEVKPFRQEFYALAAVHLDPSADAFNGRNNAYIENVKSSMEKVATICAEKMPAAGQSEPSLPGKQPGAQYQRVGGVAIPTSIEKSADHWCWIAKNREALLGGAAANRNVTVEGYGNVKIVLPMLLRSFSASNPAMDTWVAALLLDPSDYFAKLEEVEAKSDAAAGAKGVSSRRAGIVEQLAELQAKVDAAAPKIKMPPAGGHDSDMEASASKEIRKIYPKASVTATQMDAPGWTIEKNALGVPLNRFRSGRIAFKVPESKWCMERMFNWVESYSGGGQYEPQDRARILPSTRFLACP